MGLLASGATSAITIMQVRPGISASSIGPFGVTEQGSECISVSRYGTCYLEKRNTGRVGTLGTFFTSKSIHTQSAAGLAGLNEVRCLDEVFY